MKITKPDKHQVTASIMVAISVIAAYYVYQETGIMTVLAIAMFVLQGYYRRRIQGASKKIQKELTN